MKQLVLVAMAVMIGGGSVLAMNSAVDEKKVAAAKDATDKKDAIKVEKDSKSAKEAAVDKQLRIDRSTPETIYASIGGYVDLILDSTKNDDVARWMKLVQLGQDIQAQGNTWNYIVNARGGNALHVAAEYSDLFVVGVLLVAGTNLDSRDDLDQTARDIALARGFTKLADFLKDPKAAIKEYCGLTVDLAAAGLPLDFAA